MKVETDKHSGFCGGVIRAIKQAENFLQEGDGKHLFSLGAIVHNDAELDRLRSLGLITIDYEDLAQASDATGETLLIRAHGEPPKTYEQAREVGFNIVDCTCPVVLDLQKSIREASARLRSSAEGGSVLIFGKPGHAEVLGLMGQAEGTLVCDGIAMFDSLADSGELNLLRPIEIFSQTTKSPSEYAELCAYIESRMADASAMEIQEFRALDRLRIHNTICTQVASRQFGLSEFAERHDVVVFVSGKASSNGRVLCDLCKKTNFRTYHIESENEIRPEWFRPDDNVGVCGATSTPKWLLEKVSAKILEIDGNFANFAAGK